MIMLHRTQRFTKRMHIPVHITALPWNYCSPIALGNDTQYFCNSPQGGRWGYPTVIIDHLRDDFDGALLANLFSGPLHSLGTGPIVSGGFRIIGLPLSSEACKPPLTWY